MQSTVGQERKQEHFGSRNDAFNATCGDSVGLTNDREQDASPSKHSVLGDVRRITQKRGQDGRDIVEIEHTDGKETILTFDTVS